MPEISRFFGIVIKIFYNDHGPPHFHAEYGEYEVLVEIETLAVYRGSLPPRDGPRVGHATRGRASPGLGVGAEW